MSCIHITLNGITTAFPGETLAELLTLQGIPPERKGIAVAVNDTIVPQPEWFSRPVSAGDRIEIVQALAGG